MPRNLDTTLAAHLGDPVIGPAVFAEIRFRSGIERVWSGVGDFVGPNGHTFRGLGEFASVGAIGEGTDVKAEGTSVTLSGIGDTLIDVPGSPVTPPDPPFPPAPGESVAWSFADPNSRNIGTFTIPPSIFNGGLGMSGSSVGNQTTGSITIINGDALAQPDGLEIGWAGFQMPPEIPLGATITAVIPVMIATTPHIGGFMYVQGGSDRVVPTVGTQTYVFPDQGTLGGGFLAGVFNTVPAASTLTLAISFVGMAVYYTGTPKTKMSLLQEALGDVWVGAPAKIWFGLINVGAATLLGVPYLVFSGVVDKPSVHVGTDTLSITLALENRLVNLQRANQRRYTAADQKIHFPTDMAFNWVESLNDIALRWGS